MDKIFFIIGEIRVQDSRGRTWDVTVEEDIDSGEVVTTVGRVFHEGAEVERPALT